MSRLLPKLLQHTNASANAVNAKAYGEIYRRLETEPHSRAPLDASAMCDGHDLQLSLKIGGAGADETLFVRVFSSR